MRLELVCWHCGKGVVAEVVAPPQFAFELVGWANDVGMLGVFDNEHRRALIFCNEEHANAQRRKDGQFRLRPIRPVAQEACQR